MKEHFCNMYLIPYYFVDPKEIKFPKNYKMNFPKYKNATEVLISYGEVAILCQMVANHIINLVKKNKIKFNKKNIYEKLDKCLDKLFDKGVINIVLKDEVNKVLELRNKILYECFATPHQSIMFYSDDMNKQFNYIYYLFVKVDNKLVSLLEK